jgi:hypothetical protein
LIKEGGRGAGLGTAPWLIGRLWVLEYPLPTTIQLNAFEAVDAILLCDDDDDDDKCPTSRGIAGTGGDDTLSVVAHCPH